jgi:hypothetical protein
LVRSLAIRPDDRPLEQRTDAAAAKILAAVRARGVFPIMIAAS